MENYSFITCECGNEIHFSFIQNQSEVTIFDIEGNEIAEKTFCPCCLLPIDVSFFEIKCMEVENEIFTY